MDLALGGLITLELKKCGTEQNKKLRGPLVRERTIPTERPPLVDEI
jgi:hypothetical protein